MCNAATWATFSCTIDEEVFLIRLRDNLSVDIASLRFPYHLQIALPLPLHDPTLDDLDELDDLEFDLCRTMECGLKSVLVNVSSNGRWREICFYVNSRETAKIKVNLFLNVIGRSDIKFLIQEDPTWSLYRRYSVSNTSMN